jgi:DNA-binding transcriptional LysR family regulator
MQNTWKTLHSPRNLIIFEVAARLNSFTKAAQELNIQQPAVSAAIKQLEASIDVLLFNRDHKKITLTYLGQKLLDEITEPLSQISTSIENIRATENTEYVTLNSSSAFAHYWMMPRLNHLRELHGNIDLRLQSSFYEPNIDAEDINLAIRRGNGDWKDCNSALICSEIIYPAASPQYKNAFCNFKYPAELLEQSLIHLEEPIRERPSWQEWFKYHNINFDSEQKGLRFNDYALVVQAAMAGEGICFGWDHTIQKLIEQGLLIAKNEWHWPTGVGFYLVWSKNKVLSQQSKIVRDWILSTAKSDHRIKNAVK